MTVIDGRTQRGKERESFLPFEGFLEALCRVAVLKALPTDEEIQSAGCAHAGVYLEWLELEEPDAYEQLVETRNTDFGDEPDYQPIHRCVAHLIETMIYRIERLAGVEYDANVPREKTLMLTDVGARKWTRAAIKLR